MDIATEFMQFTFMRVVRYTAAQHSAAVVHGYDISYVKTYTYVCMYAYHFSVLVT